MGSRWVVRCAECLCCMWAVSLLVALGACRLLESSLRDQAINTMAVINDHQAHEYCHEFLEMRNLSLEIWWPGCGFAAWAENQTCGEPCFSKEWMQSIVDFNRAEDPGRIVSYKNRPGEHRLGDDVRRIEDLTLRGWLLRAAKDAPAPGGPFGGPRPRIVVQHGFNTNSNKFREVVMATMLRQLGFDVLLNNFRDHCYSDDSEHLVQWGDAYPYDLLGAWDYLVEDPDGHLGGAVDAGSVGIVGMSMGGFTAVNSLSLDGRVPAAWADMPLATPEAVFSYGALAVIKEKLGILPGPAAEALLGALRGHLIPSLWDAVEDYAAARGVNMSAHLPGDLIPRAPDVRRPLTLVGNTLDETIPIQNVVDIAKLAKDYPEKFDVEMYQGSVKCNGENHCITHLSAFQEYKAMLCKFWYKVFGADEGRCPRVPSSQPLVLFERRKPDLEGGNGESWHPPARAVPEGED